MKTVLITGASSGIGKAFAYLYAQKGYNLFLIARREKELQIIARELKEKFGIDCQYFSADLSKIQACEEVYKYTSSNNIEINILINNAGFGIYGEFGREELKEYLNLIDLNCKALITLTYLYLQDMKKRKEGAVLNISSVAGLFPGPLMSLYYASKAFVLSFSRGLKEEVKDDGIVVSCLCPGPIKTGFADRAKASNLEIFKKSAKNVERVAEYGIYLLEHKRAYGITPFWSKCSAFFVSLLPSPLDARLIKFAQSLKKKAK